MRGALFAMGLVVSASVLAGCAAEVTPKLRRGTGPVAPSDDGPAAAAAEPAPPSAEAVCASAPAATRLSTFTDAGNVFLVGKAVFFQSGTKALRVMKDATGTKEVVSSPNMVSLYADATTLVLVETTGDAPEATLRVINAVAPEVPADAPEGTTPPEPDFPEFGALRDANGELGGATSATNYNAGSAKVFASDATSFYLQGEDADGDTTIEQVSKANPASRTKIVTIADSVVTNPQVASRSVWYVRDTNRVYKVALADPDNDVPQGEPVEVFGLQYTTCNLAVAESGAFCSVGTGVERRDLTGGGFATIFDEAKSKLGAARFGKTTSYMGSLFVQSDEPDTSVKYVIRSLQPSASGVEESFAACNRNLITSLAVDGTHVAWTEKETGLFIAPR